MVRRTRDKKKKVTVSLEIHEKFVKLCETTFAKPEPICRLAKKEIGFLNELKPFEGKVFLNIPKNLVMTRVLRLPSTNDDEIKNMIKIESLKQTPYKDEDVIIGHRIIEKFKDGYSNVLLSITEADTINRLIGILKDANLKAEKIALSSESLFGWYSLVKEKIDPSATSIALVNIDSESIDLDIIENGRLVFARAFSFKSKQTIIEEMKKSFAAYRKERNRSVDKIYISGAGNKIREIEPILKEEIGMPFEIIPQAENLKLGDTLEEDLSEVSFVELIGLSLRNDEIEINLLPDKVKEENELHFLKRSLLKSLVFLCLIALISFGIIAKKIYDKSCRLNLLNSKIKSMEPEVLKAKRMKEDMEIIKGEIQKKPLAIDILSEIYRITPKDVVFSLFDYESGKTLIVRGNAPSLEEVVKFIGILEKSQYFENVKVKYTAKRRRTAKEVTDFEIVCALSKAG